MMEQLDLFNNCEYIDRWEDKKDKEVAKLTLKNIYEQGYQDGKEDIIKKIIKALKELPQGISDELVKKSIKGLLDQCR